MTAGPGTAAAAAAAVHGCALWASCGGAPTKHGTAAAADAGGAAARHERPAAHAGLCAPNGELPPAVLPGTRLVPAWYLPGTCRLPDPGCRLPDPGWLRALARTASESTQPRISPVPRSDTCPAFPTLQGQPPGPPPGSMPPPQQQHQHLMGGPPQHQQHMMGGLPAPGHQQMGMRPPGMPGFAPAGPPAGTPPPS